MESSEKEIIEIESEKPSRFMVRMANLEKSKKELDKRLSELERKYQILIKSLRR